VTPRDARAQTSAAVRAATPFEAYRRGADVDAPSDLDRQDLATTRVVCAAIGGWPARPPWPPSATAVRADLRALPFPDASVRPRHRREVLEHIPRRRTAIGTGPGAASPVGRAAVTCRAGSRSGSAGRCPTSTTPTWAATCASTGRGQLSARLAAGLDDRRGQRPRAAQPVLVAQVRGRTTTLPCARTTSCWSGTHRTAAVDPLGRARLNPVLGKSWCCTYASRE
jgi:hypothetical protein